MKKFAFTLAEIMIVLSVIAILTAILLPSARNAMPNEKVMKFKKGHNTLYSVISELVNSDKYYQNGDLGVKANGEAVNRQLRQADRMYFIQTFADVLSVSYLEPKDVAGVAGQIGLFDYSSCNITGNFSEFLDTCSNQVATSEIIQARKNSANNACTTSTSEFAKQIITNDGIWYWDPGPNATFGLAEYTNGTGRRYFHLMDSNGLNIMYKTFCMDIDGVPENATATDCINECPFTYGIRVDGKIFTSGKVDEWLEKSIQDKD